MPIRTRTLSSFCLSEKDYNERSEKTLDKLLEQLEALGDKTDLLGYDVEYSVCIPRLLIHNL